jgi:hypothetical protein
MTEKTYTQSEVEVLASALRDSQETLEALECARIVMSETRQYPRFIARLDYLIRSIEGSATEEEEVVEKKEVPKPATVLVESKKK